MSCECMYPLPHTPEGHKERAHSAFGEWLEDVWNHPGKHGFVGPDGKTPPCEDGCLTPETAPTDEPPAV